MSDKSDGGPILLRGRAVTSDDQPLENALVVAIGFDYERGIVREGMLGHALTGAGTVTSGQRGRFEIAVDQDSIDALLGADGVGHVLFMAYAGADLMGATIEPITRENVARVDVTIQLRGVSDVAQPTTGSQGGRNGPTPAGRSDETAAEDLVGEVIDAISGIGGRPVVGASRASGAGAGLDRLFDDAMYRVLGARVRPDRPRDLETAFDRVFVEKDVDGRSEVEYRGTSGTASLPTEPRSVSSGAQAVIYRKALSQLVPVRQSLRELEADDEDDQDEFEAVRDVVDGKLGELVTALGRELRPPVSRIDGIFELLLGTPATNGTPVKEGALARLAKLVGFKGNAQQIDPDDITLDEDRATTRFLEVKLFVTELNASWKILRDQFKQPGKPGSLRNRLDFLTLRLDRVAAATADLEDALTAATVDEAEREFIYIQDDPPASLAELIAWLKEFAVGSKSFDSRPGIEAVEQTAGEIGILVDSALKLADDTEAPPALRYRKVRRALREIAQILREIEESSNGTGGNGSGAGQPAGNTAAQAAP